MPLRAVLRVCVVAGALVLSSCSGESGTPLPSRPGPSAVAAPSSGNPCAEGYPSAQPTQAYPAPLARGLPRAVSARLDAVVSGPLATVGRRSGLTAAVVTGHGTWVGAAGRALDRSRLLRSSSLAIGSITKTFTAAEVLHLVATGRVDLASRVSPLLTPPIHDNGATVHDLLDMRSGIRDYVDQPLIDTIDRQPTVHIGPEQVLSQFVPHETDKAGVLFNYSNSNYVLLGQLIEKVTGVPYATAVRRDLLRPAGLTHVTVQDAERAPDVSGPDPYLPSRAFASAAWSAGGILADARDIATWGYLLYGGRLPDAACLAQMPARGDRQYGLGTDSFRATTSSLAYVGHHGDIGPYHSTLIAVRGRPVAVAVLTVSNDPTDPMAVADALAAVVDHH